MCGIFGFALRRVSTDSDHELGLAGIRGLRHRGPDGSGWWEDRRAGVFLGHARLRILDLSSASDQPMVRSDAVLSYNGELYNFVEVREQLAREGVRFDTTGDTEVVFRAWLQWGSLALDRFDGMFAFALADGEDLHLVTDPFGEKPLYWAEMSDGTYFSSEAGALAHLLGIPPELEEGDLEAFLALGFLPAPRTGFRNVYRMPPATHIVIRQGAIHSTRRYWAPPDPWVGRSRPTPLTSRELDAVHGELVQSVRRRIRSDVPLGLFLSAGVDSSLVGAIATKDLGLQMRALTVAFPDGRDEAPRAAAIAAHLGLRHTVIDSRAAATVVRPATIVDLYGELDANLTIASVAQMSLAAREHLTVVLTGLGGDELFFGYGRYQVLYRYEQLLGLPAAVRRVIAGCASALHATHPRMRTLAALCTATDPCRVLAVKNGVASTWLWKLPAMQDVSRSLFGGSEPLFIQARSFDLQHTMPSSYIPAMERGSMQASLELRTPYLSRSLLHVVNQFDARRLVAFGQKSVLKDILRRYVPDSFIDQPKQGFVFPDGRFLASLQAGPPVVPGLAAGCILDVWRRRSHRNWQTLAVRLAIAEAWTRQPAPWSQRPQVTFS